MAYYNEMIKNPSRTTINYDSKGMEELTDLVGLRKHSISYKINDFLDEYNVKETYCLSGTEVNTIATKTASALSNLIKTKKYQKKM
jgi:hypothetical protein